jgi:putative peptidoglycan binding protein
MLPPIVDKLPQEARRRFHEAYDNPKRPIGWGEPDDIVVALLQVWLYALGASNFPRSIVYEIDQDTVNADGIFGKETWLAIMAFQSRKDLGLKADGMVGHNTIDRIYDLLHQRRVNPPQLRKASVTAVTRPFKCPPGALICPEPPR